jgi:hypothetical protein
MNDQAVAHPEFNTRTVIVETFRALGLVSEAERERYQALTAPVQMPPLRVFVTSHTRPSFEMDDNA